tara:strand:+ start:881 stop:1048 length:168 start_codon:yes stop_codon:yes gene_type:complete
MTKAELEQENISLSIIIDDQKKTITRYEEAFRTMKLLMPYIKPLPNPDFKVETPK